jgi:dTDP-glucose 4,6-dehydratase
MSGGGPSPGDVHVPRTVLVTGGCGFIGSNLVRYLLHSDPALRVVDLDALTYAGNRANLADLEGSGRYAFVHGDIGDAAVVETVFSAHAPDTVIHLAAESHVDRSIDDPLACIRTNVAGTAVLLQAARRHWQQRSDVRFHHVSSDEVYGSLATGAADERTPYDPSSPYSASKAASDHLVRAWHRTYGLPVTLSACSNNYGPYQFPEKLIPLMITRALAGEAMPVYGDGAHVRDWIHVDDHCAALDRIVRRAAAGRSYNVGGMNEQSNLALVERICDLLQEELPREGGYRRLITFVVDRPGHDRRYAIDASALRTDLAWEPAETFTTGLRRTIRWYLDHRAWVDDLVRRHGATHRRGQG